MNPSPPRQRFADPPPQRRHSREEDPKESAQYKSRYEALEMALAHAKPSIFHSDQGSQYAAWLHTGHLLEQSVTISMSDKAGPTQNGLVERFMRTLKEEHVDYSEYTSFDDALNQIKHGLEVVYMWERIHQALDYLTLVEFELAVHVQARYAPA